MITSKILSFYNSKLYNNLSHKVGNLEFRYKLHLETKKIKNKGSEVHNLENT